MKVKLLPREILPRYRGGSDWSCQQWVLLRWKNKSLVWWPSHKYWRDQISGYVHGSPSLIFFKNSATNDHYTICPRKAQERLGKPLLKRYGDYIAGAFSVHPYIIRMMDPRFTTVIVDHDMHTPHSTDATAVERTT